MNYLTPHFTLEELTYSSTGARLGLDNTPSDEVKARLVDLCVELLEPIRHGLGDRPIHSDSGYRSQAVNAAVGGVPTSAHCEGRADDLVVPGIPLLVVYEEVAKMDLPFDQLILEYGVWVHAAIPRPGDRPRRQLLMKFADGRGYQPFDPAAAAAAIP